MTRQLYDHQKRAVGLFTQNKRFGLFHDAGLGKTLSVLSFLKKENFSGVVICPESAKLSWEEENSEIEAQISMYNYTSFHRLAPSDIEGSVLIFDEAHHLSSPLSLRSKKAVQLTSSNVEKVFLLSGTPIADKPLGLYMFLVLLGVRKFGKGDFYSFQNKYCILRNRVIHLRGGVKRRFKEIVGYKNLSFLREEIEKFSDFLKISEVFDMPPTTFIPQFSELSKSQRKEYTSNLTNFALSNMHLCSQINLENMKIFLQNLSETTKEKIVVFSYFKDIITNLSATFDSPHLIGDQDIKTRGEMLEKFKGESQFLFSTYGTGKESLNLQYASYGVFVDLPQYLLDFSQSLRRIYRIGQKKPVFFYFFAPKGTQMERVFTLLNRKFMLTTKVFPENQNFDILTLFNNVG